MGWRIAPKSGGIRRFIGVRGRVRGNGVDGERYGAHKRAPYSPYLSFLVIGRWTSSLIMARDVGFPLGGGGEILFSSLGIVI